MTRISALLLLALLSPASAQDQVPANHMTLGQGSQGSVARLVLAHHLFAFGKTQKDPLTVLNAARLAASVVLIETRRPHEVTGEAAKIGQANVTTPATMFDTASLLAVGDDPLLDLIETVRGAARFAPTADAVSTTSSLSAAQTETWPIAFFGASLAEIAILGEAASALDLRVTDQSGNLVCQDIGPEVANYCSFYPAENGTFLVTVLNAGSATGTYLLLSN